MSRLFLRERGVHLPYVRRVEYETLFWLIGVLSRNNTKLFWAHDYRLNENIYSYLASFGIYLEVETRYLHYSKHKHASLSTDLGAFTDQFVV